ncbi:hypothetical protein V6N13_036318 [Hibiscus sabdariffa]
MRESFGSHSIYQNFQQKRGWCKGGCQLMYIAYCEISRIGTICLLVAASPGRKLKGKSLIVLTLKLSQTVMVYSTWKERNKRLFQGHATSENDIFNSIKCTISIRLGGNKIYRTDTVNRILCTDRNIRD